VRARIETFPRSASGRYQAMSAAVARALKNGNLWLTLGYVALILLLIKAYA
jgi:hypothetical protein